MEHASEALLSSIWLKTVSRWEYRGKFQSLFDPANLGWLIRKPYRLDKLQPEKRQYVAEGASKLRAFLPDTFWYDLHSGKDLLKRK